MRYLSGPEIAMHVSRNMRRFPGNARWGYCGSVLLPIIKVFEDTRNPHLLAAAEDIWEFVKTNGEDQNAKTVLDQHRS